MPAREIGQAKTWKDVYNESYFSKKGGFLPRMREDGKLKGKKRRVTMEGLEKASGGVLRWEVSWRRKGSGTSPKRECWKTEEPPREDRDLLHEYQAMHEENFLSRWLSEEREEEEEQGSNRRGK